MLIIGCDYHPRALRAQVCPPRSGATEKRIAKRPPQEHINAAFAELPDDIQFSKVRINQRYGKLGLHVTD
jgi:hypothetical protein